MQGFFNTGPGRATTDAIWRAKVVNAIDVDEGKKAAEVRWDFSKCYENVRYRDLQVAAAEQGYPVRSTCRSH